MPGGRRVSQSRLARVLEAPVLGIPRADIHTLHPRVRHCSEFHINNSETRSTISVFLVCCNKEAYLSYFFWLMTREICYSVNRNALYLFS
jgi:hypothetical protein